ncbi:MAG: hypothetical protein ACK4ZN_10435 [Oceanibaculum sp.]|jgi:hypothetical protein
MFSGRIGFIALQQGLGLTGVTGTGYENHDHRAAAEAASETAAEPAPARPERRSTLLLSLLSAVF